MAEKSASLGEAERLEEGLIETDTLEDGDKLVLGEREELGEKLAEELGLKEELGESEALGLKDCEELGDNDVEGDNDKLELVEGLILAEGDKEALGLLESDIEELGDKLALGDKEAEGEMEAEAEGESEAEGLLEDEGLIEGETAETCPGEVPYQFTPCLGPGFPSSYRKMLSASSRASLGNRDLSIKLITPLRQLDNVRYPGAGNFGLLRLGICMGIINYPMYYPNGQGFSTDFPNYQSHCPFSS